MAGETDEGRYDPPPGMSGVDIVVWARRQIETATEEAQIRGAMRALMALEYKPQRSYILWVRQRLLEVGAKDPNA